MQSPKVVVIGSGSLYFGRQAIWQMVKSPVLNGGTLALVDTDVQRERKMSVLARKAVEHTGVDLKIESSTDRRDVLEGADFVVLSFAERSVEFRGIDCEVSRKYGVRMCSGDTIGPGGIFRTLREFPEIMDVAEDVEKLCPDAWVINYINPTASHGVGLKKYAPQLKSFALCDGLHMPHIKRNYAKRAGIIEREEEFTDGIDRRFDMRIAGPNHFTWMIKAEFDGKDVLPIIAESVRKEAATETDGGDTGAKTLYNANIGYALYEIFGCLPVCVAHTKEYVRFWQGLGQIEEPVPPLSIWETRLRYRRHAEMWEEVDQFVSGDRPMNEFFEIHGPDHATDIIENMVGNFGKRFYVNTLNGDAVGNMGEDRFMELLCEFGDQGPTPVPVGDMPGGIRGLMEQVLDTHELSADAAFRTDRAILRRAMLTDPLINSIADADNMIRELLDAERDVLPESWFSEIPDRSNRATGLYLSETGAKSFAG